MKISEFGEIVEAVRHAVSGYAACVGTEEKERSASHLSRCYRDLVQALAVPPKTIRDKSIKYAERWAFRAQQLLDKIEQESAGAI